MKWPWQEEPPPEPRFDLLVYLTGYPVQRVPLNAPLARARAMAERFGHGGAWLSESSRPTFLPPARIQRIEVVPALGEGWIEATSATLVIVPEGGARP